MLYIRNLSQKELRVSEWHAYISNRELIAEKLVVPCPAGMVSGNNALAVRYALFRRPMPNRGQKHTAKFEYGTEADSQSDKKAKRENSI